MKNKLTLILCSLFVGLLIAVLRPVPSPTADNTYDASVTVKNVWEGGVHDVVFSFQHSAQVPYINRGIEQGLVIDELKQKLVGQSATFKLIDHWTLLDPGNNSPTVVFIQTSEGEVLYNAMN